MDEMMHYIFANLASTERTLDFIAKKLKYQARINRRMMIFAGVAALYVAVAESHRNRQDEKIKKLCKEVEDLKEIEAYRTTKGE